MTDEIQEFFDDPETLRVALEMETHLPRVKQDLHEWFWRESVAPQIEERLEREGHEALWEVRFDDNLFDGYNWKQCAKLQIAWRRRRDSPHFAVTVEYSQTMYFGILRGSQIDAKRLSPADQTLRNRLKNGGFTSSTAWWPGRRHFHKLGMPRFNLDRADDVIALCREKADPNGPLTARVVKEIWDLFTVERAALEELNRNYPYDDSQPDPEP